MKSPVEPVAIIADQFPRVVIPLIHNAEDNIRIIVFDWRFYPTVLGSSVSLFNDAIFAAERRGVHVRALVNSNDVLSRLRIGKCEARELHSKKLLHTKMLLIDNTVLVIGSHNYTQSAFSSNHEASVLVRLGEEDNPFVQYFDALWGV